MTTRAVLFLLLSACVGARPDLRAQEPEPAGVTDVVAAVDSSVGAVMEEYRVPGAAGVVVELGRLALLKSHGVVDVETGRPADPDSTVFPVGWLSNPATASGALQAADAGLPDLHASIDRDPIRVRIESRFPIRSPRPGFAPTPPPSAAGSRDASSVGEVGVYLKRSMPPFVRPPGSLPVHSNHGYALVVPVLETVAGRSLGLSRRGSSSRWEWTGAASPRGPTGGPARRPKSAEAHREAPRAHVTLRPDPSA